MAGVILITGGGRGIGAATARLALKAGYSVCVHYLRDRSSAEKLVSESKGKAIAVAGVAFVVVGAILAGRKERVAVVSPTSR